MKAFPVHLVAGAALSLMSSICPAVIAQTGKTVISAADQPDVAANQSDRPALNLTVLDSVEVQFPDHSVFYQRVAPPLAPPPKPPAPAPVLAPLSAAQRAAAEARAKKTTGVLLLSATVYDRQVTQLRWSAGGREYRAWSNVDFNHLAGHGEIETEDTVFLLMMALGNETRESVAESNRFAPEWERFAAEQGLADHWEIKAVPALAKFPAGRSTYLLSGDAPTDDSLAAMDALHRYYDANRLQLTVDCEKREAAYLAREQWLREHPPLPQDTVIKFWPKKSRTYPTTGK